MSNMTVISVSLTDKNLENLDKLQKTLGLAGRSETVRVCVRAAEDELRERERLEGDVEGILIVIHQADNDQGLEQAIHEYKSVIATQVHSHLKNGKCLDVFLVGGKAEAIKEMLSFFQGAESLEYTKFVQS